MMDKPLIYQCRDEIEPQVIHRDGQIDATLVEDFYPKPEIPYLVRHGLGRPVKQYEVVFCDKPMKYPACARDAEGRYINDVDHIALIFFEGNITVRMRFA